MPESLLYIAGATCAAAVYPIAPFVLLSACIEECGDKSSDCTFKGLPWSQALSSGQHSLALLLWQMLNFLFTSLSTCVLLGGRWWRVKFRGFTVVQG